MWTHLHHVPGRRCCNHRMVLGTRSGVDEDHPEALAVSPVVSRQKYQDSPGDTPGVGFRGRPRIPSRRHNKHLPLWQLSGQARAVGQTLAGRRSWRVHE